MLSGDAKQADAMLHVLWTKAVGTDDYVKDEWKELERLIHALNVSELPDGWLEVSPTHYQKTDGGPIVTDGTFEGMEVWQIDHSFAAQISGKAGRWYGEDEEGFQTKDYSTRDHVFQVVGTRVPCGCGCSCGREALNGWRTCGSCTFDNHGPSEQPSG